MASNIIRYVPVQFFCNVIKLLWIAFLHVRFKKVMLFLFGVSLDIGCFQFNLANKPSGAMHTHTHLTVYVLSALF